MRFLLSAVLFPLLTACATRPPLPEVAPLEVSARFDVEYSGAIETVLPEQFLPGQLLPAGEVLEASVVDPDEAQVRIDVRVVRMPAAEVRRVLGIETGSATDGPVAKGGGTVGRAAMHATLDALVENGVAEEVAAPSLVSHVGRPAKSAIARRVSLVRGYRLTGSGARFVGDPIVEQVEFGLSLETVASDLDADGSLQLMLDVRSADMMGEPRRVSGSFDARADVAVQVPLACRQRLRCTTRLAQDEGAFVSGLHVPGTDDVVVVFADARTGSAVSGREDGEGKASAGR